jgi:hypothetical protein
MTNMATPLSRHDFSAFETLDVTCKWSVQWHRLIDSAEPLASFVPSHQSINKMRCEPKTFFDPATALKRKRVPTASRGCSTESTAIQDDVDESVDNIDPDDVEEAVEEKTADQDGSESLDADNEGTDAGTRCVPTQDHPTPSQTHIR